MAHSGNAVAWRLYPGCRPRPPHYGRPPTSRRPPTGAPEERGTRIPHPSLDGLMKLDNRNLALKGLLEILPPRLERYTRSVLGERTSPEELRRLLTADGTAPEVPDPDLADLSTQIRILTAHDVDGRLPSPPQGLTAALEEVQLFRDEAVRADSLSADRVLAALDAVGDGLLARSDLVAVLVLGSALLGTGLVLRSRRGRGRRGQRGLRGRRPGRLGRRGRPRPTPHGHR